MIKIRNKRTLLLAILLSCLVSVLVSIKAFAEKPILNNEHPSRYYVKEGDTLWDISNLFLQNPWSWPEIWHINEQIANPHLIYPGDELSLLYFGTERQPALMLTKRGPQSKPTLKLSPQKRTYQISSTIPTIPLSKIDSFLNSTRVVDKQTINDAPYVIAGHERHLVMGKGDTIYVMGDWSQPQQTYSVYRAGAPYIDPETKEVLGYEARDIGKVSFETADNEVGTFSILKAGMELREYDRLLPADTETVDANYYPKSPNGDIRGEIIRVFSGVKNIGQYDVVVINRGTREAVEKGDVFAIYRRGMIVRDKLANFQKIQLPDEKSGLLMVFKTYEKISLALVLQSKTVLSIHDKIAKP